MTSGGNRKRENDSVDIPVPSGMARRGWEWSFVTPPCENNMGVRVTHGSRRSQGLPEVEKGRCSGWPRHIRGRMCHVEYLKSQMHTGSSKGPRRWEELTELKLASYVNCRTISGASSASSLQALRLSQDIDELTPASEKLAKLKLPRTAKCLVSGRRADKRLMERWDQDTYRRLYGKSIIVRTWRANRSDKRRSWIRIRIHYWYSTQGTSNQQKKRTN